MTFTDLLCSYHIMPQFPPGAMLEAEKIQTEVSKMDMSGRMDLTDTLIITIDGDDAKDFDDAISVELLENGNFCLGVHIADVTHYVKENSAIDRAAYSRGTSVYLIDTVIPMLPFELSNGLCSLRPDEIRLTVSVFMEITPRGKIEHYEISKSFIKSKNRMTYDNVTKLLDGDEILISKYPHLVSMLQNAKRLASILNKKRVSGGSIEFVTHESLITLDKSGKAVNVEKYPITLSNNIIEEFMLICNVVVARHLSSRGLPCVYRVHAAPDFEAVERLAKVLPMLGVDFRFSPNLKPADFQRVLDDVRGTEIFDVVNYIVLRSMAKAKYSEKNAGHFGLSFSDYCHFTSPIRRYADIAVHRVLKESLDGEISQKRIAEFKELAISASISASMTEVNATDAEFAWKDFKKAEYMSEHIGEIHTARITHITSSGFFAELENTVEGFVAARGIEDDAYIMTDSGLSMKGIKTQKEFTVGDEIKIRVSAVDLGEGKIDFELAGTGNLKAFKRKRKAMGKSELSRKQKAVLRSSVEENRELRLKKKDEKDKAILEKTIFENAVTYEIMMLLEKGRKFKKPDRNFMGITIKDMASMVAMPIYKNNLLGINEISTKNALIAASKTAGNTMEILGDSFGFSNDSDVVRIAAEYVCAALRHLDACMKQENIQVPKREHEYERIMLKLIKREGRD